MRIRKKHTHPGADLIDHLLHLLEGYVYVRRCGLCQLGRAKAGGAGCDPKEYEFYRRAQRSGVKEIEL